MKRSRTPELKSEPLVTYADLAPLINRIAAGEEGLLPEEPIAFFKTSGSTAIPKLIPVTPSFARAKARAFGKFWKQVYRDHPHLETGRIIANFGDSESTPERTASDREILSETTFWNRRMQMFQSGSGWPLPPRIRRIRDPDLRFYMAARIALQGPLHAVMALNPSTIVKLCRTIDQGRECLLRGIRDGTHGRQADLKEDRDIVATLEQDLTPDPARARALHQTLGNGDGFALKSLWPDLELIICWQSEPVKPYLRLLQPYAGELAFRDYITQASEAIMAIPFEDNVSGGELALGTHSFEFIPEAASGEEQPATLDPRELEEGERYEIVTTTSNGFHRYRIGDMVEVLGFRNGVPVIEFKYRTGKTSSMTGEKLTERHVLEALRMLAATGPAPSEFLLFPRTRGPDPHYGALLSNGPGPGGEGEEAESWVQQLDAALMQVNPEYAAKRRSGRLGAPQAISAGKEGFDRLRNVLAARGTSETQVKLGVLHREHDLDLLIYPEEADAGR